LYAELKKSADQFNITNLEKNLNILKKKEGNLKLLAEHLEQLLKDYKIEDISKILEKVSIEKL
jgi:hypothetical protein